jgi:molybdenum cofactor cytidylyltransferase
MNNSGIIILAAGNSSRFGSAKQLLLYNNKTLLQHVIDEASASGGRPVVVVTGADNEVVSASIRNENVEIVFNESWKEGMASGIVAGVKKIIALKNDIENIIIAVCDQPFISSLLLKKLYQKKLENPQHIVASAYAGTIGTPVLFSQKYFDVLMNLNGDEGAKKIILAQREDVATVDFPQGDIDIDTKTDYEQLPGKQNNNS